jgi:hypothetical protein
VALPFASISIWILDSYFCYLYYKGIKWNRYFAYEWSWWEICVWKKTYLGGLKAYLRPPWTSPIAILLVEMMDSSINPDFCLLFFITVMFTIIPHKWYVENLDVIVMPCCVD